MTSTALSVRSPAKINWSLRVVGRRADGFHEIESLVSAVTLYDELAFTGVADSVIELVCDGSDLPTDERNLVVQAATLLAGATGCQRGMSCRSRKRIPVGGGLGGGSSNAASTLEALYRLWEVELSADRQAALAARLGSDVSFFLHGGSAVMSGRGEIIRPVRLAWRGWIVLLMPAVSISTAAVYAAWEPGESPPASATDRLVAGKAGVAANAVAWMEGTFNMLEGPVMKVCPAMQEFIGIAAALAGRPIRVSGSGSTLFVAFDTRAEAERFALSAGEALGIRTEVVQPVEHAANHGGGTDGDN